MTLYNFCNYAIYCMMIFRILIWFTVVFEYSYKKYAVRSRTYSHALNKINIVKEKLLIWMEKDLKCSRNIWDSEKMKIEQTSQSLRFFRHKFWWLLKYVLYFRWKLLLFQMSEYVRKQVNLFSKTQEKFTYVNDKWLEWKIQQMLLHFVSILSILLL